MNIEEALIILRFDGAAATNGIRNTRAALNDLTRGAADYGRQLGASLSNVAKVTAELSVVGRGIATAFNTAIFIPNLINGTAEATRNMGQFAANVGMSADKIKALQQFMGQLGGSDTGTNAFIADIAKRKAALASGFVSPYEVMPAQFFAGEGDYNKAVGDKATTEDAITEYAKVYENLKRQRKDLGKTDAESEAYASQQMMQMGVQEDMLQVLKLGNAEIQKRIDLESKRVPVLGKEDLENAKAWTQAWAHIEQSIDNSATNAKRGVTNIAVESGYVKAETAFIDKQLANTEKSFKSIAKIISDPSSLNLKDLKEIITINPFFEKLFEWLSKISNISLDNIKNPIKSAYDANTTTAEKVHDQDVIGNVAAFFGDKDAMAAKETLENSDKYGSTLSKQEKMKVAMDYFVKQGRTVDQAAGMVANIEAESGGMSADVVSGKRRGDSGSAYGIGQWRGDRQSHFQDLYGKPIQGAGLMEQLRYYNDEFGAYEIGADKKLRQSKTAYEAGANVSTYFERPRDTQGEAHSRGSRAENLAASYKASQQTPVDTKSLVQPTTPTQGANVTINVQQDIKATDPMETGRECKSAIENMGKSAAFQSGMCK